MDCDNKVCKYLQSKKFKIIMIVIFAIIIVLLAFKAGEFVGFKKAGFSYQWGENYQRNFGGPRGGILNDFKGRDFMNAHGNAGSIIKIDSNVFILKGQNNFEQTIVVSGQTMIRRQQDVLKVSDLKVDDRVTIIGSPNGQGQIEAKLIRVF